MDKKFLDKVIDQIVSETEIDYDQKRVYTPFSTFSFLFLSLLSPRSPYFSDHCKEVYGLTKNEIEYVWKQYKDIIKDKIKDKNNLNESTGMNKKYLDKVVDQLVKETRIESNGAYTYFLPPPYYPVLYFLIFPLAFSDHCKEVYGLTKNEINYVWEQYKNIIKDMIKDKNKPLNESTGNKFLDKVVDQLVKETRIESNGFYAPFLSSLLSSTYPLSLSLFIFPFSDHCKEVYGLTKNEIEYVWEEYKKIIKDMKKDKPLNESTGNKKYLDKVVDQLVSETRIGSNKITPFFIPLSSFFISTFLNTLSPLPSFSRHCKEVYGLNEQEIEYVWKQYKDIIKDMIKDKPLNESNRNKFLDKVVDQLVNETRIESNRVYTPFTLSPYVVSIFSLSRRIVFHPFPLFQKHCKNMYGLNEEEVEYVWHEYSQIITDKIKNKPLNESTEDNALNKIVDQLVKETRIGSNKITPFFIPLSCFFPPYSSLSPLPSFSRHCKEVYGLNEQEIEYVWEQYKKIINNKIISENKIIK